MAKRGSFEGGASASGKGCSRARARRAALYATAKIALGPAGALSLALAACGGKTSGEEVAAGLDGHGEDTPIAAGGAGAAGVATGAEVGTSTGGTSGEGLACAGTYVPTVPLTPPGPSDSEFTCCVDFVAASALANAETKSDPAVANCCRLILAAVDLDYKREPEARRTYNPCCGPGDPSLFNHSMCAPWGPPVPPALDWEAA
jgi:hypothetical protein